MDSKDSFFYRQRLPLYFLIVAFGLIALCAMTKSGLGLILYAWFFPAGLIQSVSGHIAIPGALPIGYALYLSLFIALCYARTAARAQSLLIVLLIIVITTVSGCRKVLSDLN
jgi:hypothetical protein